MVQDEDPNAGEGWSRGGYQSIWFTDLNKFNKFPIFTSKKDMPRSIAATICSFMGFGKTTKMRWLNRYSKNYFSFKNDKLMG